MCSKPLTAEELNNDIDNPVDYLRSVMISNSNTEDKEEEGKEKAK